MEMSISFKTGTQMTNLKHNNRDLTESEYKQPAHQHIQRENTHYNIIVKQEDLDDVYKREFGEALKNYNAKQRRADRKIKDYKSHVYHSKTLDLQREFIVALGAKEDWDELPTQDKLIAGQKIAEYIQEFEIRHPQLRVFNAIVHLDEAGAPHAHFNVVPVATGYKNGLEKQPSFSKALTQEGNILKGKAQYKAFREKEIRHLEQKLKELGHTRKLVGKNNIKDMNEYKKLMRDFEAVEKELDDKYLDEYSKLHELQNEKFVMETMTIPKIESQIDEKQSEMEEIDLELEKKKGLSEELSEKLKKQKDGYEHNKSVLQKQKEKIKKISRFEVQDYHSQKESQELIQELESAIPKRFGGTFSFSRDFVDRLKIFVTTIVDKLNQARSQNNLLQHTVEELMIKQQDLTKKNQNLADYTTELKTENNNLKEENKSLKASKTLLEDIEEVITEKEANSLNKRLEGLRETREASRRRYNPNHSKGRSI